MDPGQLRVGRLSYELLEEIVTASPEGLLVLDASGPDMEIVYANPACEALCGAAGGELDGTPWLAQVAADDDSPEVVELRRRMLCDERFETSLPMLRKDGDIWLARLRLVPLKSKDASGRLVLAQFLRHDGAKGASAELLKRALGSARRKLATLDRTDPVTGLMSRAQFDLMLRRELAVSRRESRTLSLLLFDVPELDVYRQTFGDNAADSCLRMVGAQIAGTFRRASDLCARYDGSMLAVALTGQDEAQAAELIALVERKARSLGLHNPRGRQGRYVFVRGAAVTADPASEDVDALTARAEARLPSNEPEPAPQPDAPAPTAKAAGASV